MKVKTMKKAIAVVFAAALVAPFGLGSQASAKDGDGRQINERPVANLKQGGTFRFVQVDICPNFNTSAIEGNLLNCSQVMATMLPSFIYFDKDAKIQVDQNYAKSIKASRVGGKQTVTYDLNPNAKWSDGKKIGLKDFVGMWNALKGTDKTYKITSSVGYELDKVVFKALPQAAQIAALLNGEIDYMDIGNDINALKQARDNAKISVRVAKAPTHEHFTFGPVTAVTKEVAVRQAIMLSIDRDAIAKAIQGIVDPKVKPNNNNVFLDGTACTQDNTGKLGKRDINAAQALLTGAGWSKGADGIYQKGGTRLSVKLIYPSANDNRRDTVLLASAQAKEAGIELVPTLIPTADYFGKYVLVSNFEMALFAWVGTNFPISSTSNIFRQGAAQNFGNIGSAEIDALFTKANNILDPKKRCEFANQADAKAYELVHSITLFQRNNVVGVPKNVANFGAFGFTSIDWTTVGFTK
ncbi:MAG: hypothetical protein EBS71_08320 [Actinobacteria bacterium]|nr:hypothetical protein [Actinomycetota bacterium]